MYEYEVFERERLPACSKAAGHPVETSCTILDLKGVGLGKFWDVKNYVQEAAIIGQNYYPERMGKILHREFILDVHDDLDCDQGLA